MITLQDYLHQWIHMLRRLLSSLVELLLNTFGFGGPVIGLDSGIQVQVGPVLAEGGFSVVFQAKPVSGTSNSPYNEFALKRMRCGEREMRQACLEEVQVHRDVQHFQEEEQQQQQQPSSASESSSSSYLMPLLGMAMEEQSTVCYMLFPLFPHSLRSQVNQRLFPNLKKAGSLHAMAPPSTCPWNAREVLQLFGKITQGVAELHAAGYSHRDIKLENILLTPTKKPKNSSFPYDPVLMDFGSAGSLQRPLQSRRDVLEVAEVASQHTTISYRPPELFPGELRLETIVDYTKVDVWSLGCVLFAILYGSSPFECEFSRSPPYALRIVDCNQLRVLGSIPKPPPESPQSKWYTENGLMELVEFLLQPQPRVRPSLGQVQQRIQTLLNPQQGAIMMEEQSFVAQWDRSQTY